METQAHMEMTHAEYQEQRGKEAAEELRDTEKQFLKDLYVFMKKRDTPIERIPNLGFKQIDLYLMFRTVRDLGGYHQVTAQQLWKQVYNMLGGNPRSTSAATCTRRHYEKLLLPYECHVKGISMNILPQHQPKQYPNYSNDDDVDGQKPAKRKLLSLPLPPSTHMPAPDRNGSTFPLPLLYPHYYHHKILPPHLPISSVLPPHSSPAPQPQFSFDPYSQNPTERVKEPLEHLRFLAERYKTSSGFAEPLNLSVKARETTSNPVSSFAPPSSSNNPKFLNKPSPLYSLHCPQVVRNEQCDTQDGEAGLGDTQHSHPVKAREAYSISVKPSSSPSYDSALTIGTDEGTTRMAQNPSPPKTNFTIQPTEAREGTSEVRGASLSHILPSLHRENGDEMEIEIPLSVFQNWLRLCRLPSATHGDKQLPILPNLEEHPRQRNCSDTSALTFPMNPQHQSLVAEDLRLKRRNLPSPPPVTQTTGHHHSSEIVYTSYKPLSSGPILKNPASRDVYPFHQDVNKSSSSKSPNCWGAYDQETPAAPLIQVKTDSIPLTAQQNFTTFKSYNEDIIRGGKEKSEMGPSAVLMMNSNSTSLLQLTTEEVMKLKKIISNSS